MGPATIRRWQQRIAIGVLFAAIGLAAAVIALLTAIGWPGYVGIMQRTQRTDAHLALLRIQHLQERHYARYLRYASRLGAAPNEETLPAEERSAAGHYLITLRIAMEAQAYTAIATALLAALLMGLVALRLPETRPAALAAAHEVVHITQYGSTRSLNVGAAAAIAMHSWIVQHAEGGSAGRTSYAPPGRA